MYKTNILITGGTGFIGYNVKRCLAKHNIYDYVAVGSKDFDLTNRDDVNKMLETFRPKKIIHLAAKCGGIGINQERPAQFFTHNLKMGINIVEASLDYDIQKIVYLGTVCSYPVVPKTIPFIEEEIWDGYPEPTNAGYGVAKKCIGLMLQIYKDVYGLDSSILMITNNFGKHDVFDEKKSHVIPALIKKMIDNPNRHIDIWGTGTASRDFLYAGDSAEAIVKALDTNTHNQLINIGYGKEYTIKELVDILVRLTGFKGTFSFDPSKPDGQPRRVLNNTKAKEILGWEPKTSLEDGLKKTIDWYRIEYGR